MTTLPPVEYVFILQTICENIFQHEKLLVTSNFSCWQMFSWIIPQALEASLVCHRKWAILTDRSLHTVTKNSIAHTMSYIWRILSVCPTWKVDWLNGVLRSFLTVFKSYHGNGSHYSCISWVSPALGRGSEVSCPRTLPRKTQTIQCDLNQGPLYYQSNALPLSHA